jgi:hypothetical protein
MGVGMGPLDSRVPWNYDVWKVALSTLIALFTIAPFVMNSSTHSRGVTHSAAVGLVDCNRHDPVSPCFDTKIGHPAVDLFIAGESS